MKKKKMSDTKKIVMKNAFWNWMLFFVNVVLTFFITPYIVHSLGDSRYGIWNIIISVTGYCGLLDLGIRNALVRYISKHKGENNYEKINEIIGTCFFLFLIVGVIIFFVSLMIAFNVSTFFEIPNNLMSDTQSIMLVLGCSLAIQFPLNALSGVIVSFQRYDISSKVWIIISIISNLIRVIILWQGFGLIALALVSMFFDIAAYTIMAVIGFRLFPGLSFNLKIPKYISIKKIFSFSLFSFLIGVAGRVVNYASPIIIGAKLSLEAVTYYALPAMLMTYTINIIYHFSRVLQPFASTSEAQNNFKEISAMTIWSIRTSLFIYIPISILIIYFGFDFLNLWVGTIYAQKAFYILLILPICFLFATAEMPLQDILIGMGYVKVLSYILLLEAVLSISMALLLVPYFNLEGVAMGMGVPLIITRGVIIPMVGVKKVKISLAQYWVKGVFPPIIMAAPTLIIFYLIQDKFTIDSYFDLVLVGTGIIATYFFTVICFDYDSRYLARSLFKKVFKKNEK